MKSLLLSIKPEYVERILQGTKRFEYRKRLAQEPVDAIYIYSTTPVMKVVGMVKVLGHLEMSPSALWEKTKAQAGISRAKYREYFRNCKKAYAYQLGDVLIFDTPRDLSDFGISTAPQSFVYINCNDTKST